MDDMRDIENRMQEMERTEEVAAPLPVVEGVTQDVAVQEEDNDVSLASPAVMNAARKAMEIASGRVGDEKKVEKYADEIEDIADGMLKNQLDTERLKTEKAASKNKVERENIANALYKAKQEGIRLRKEAKHESKMQKARHKAENKKAYWEAHESTLKEYGMHEGSNIISCEILLFLDGVKAFFLGLAKVSDALVKALKWILIIGLIVGVLMLVPITRNWILPLLGFIN